jgi:hypothetical protein
VRAPTKWSNEPQASPWLAEEIAGCEKNDENPWPQNQRKPFRNAVNEITATQKIRVSELVSIIEFNGERRHANLSSAIGLFVLDHFRSKSAVRSGRR